MEAKLQYRVEVNLNGPDGNAFALMSKAKYLGVKLNLSKSVSSRTLVLYVTKSTLVI